MPEPSPAIQADIWMRLAHAGVSLIENGGPIIGFLVVLSVIIWWLFPRVIKPMLDSGKTVSTNLATAAVANQNAAMNNDNAAATNLKSAEIQRDTTIRLERIHDAAIKRLSESPR